MHRREEQERRNQISLFEGEFFLRNRTLPSMNSEQAFDKEGEGEIFRRNKTELTEEQQDEATIHASV